MNIVNTNTSAICRLDAYTLICGSYDGLIFTFNTKTKETKKILQLEDCLPIQELVTDGTVLGVIAEGNGYHIYLDNPASGVIHIGENIDHMFNPFVLSVHNFAYLAIYSQNDGDVNVRRMDYFQGDNIYDILGSSLAINRYMSTANIYTLKLDDFTTWQEDTFSFDGDFFNEVRRELQENPVEYDNFSEEMVEQEMVMVSMLPKHLVHSEPKKYTYVDFVKLYDLGDMDNPYVVSGGRDRRIIITDFNFHKVFFDKEFENVPRCCSYNSEKIFVGCDEGEIVIIDKLSYESKVISLGEVMFKFIKALSEGRYIVAVNNDNAIFCYDLQEMEVVSFELIEEEIKDIQILRNHVFAIGAGGVMVDIEF